MSHGQQGLSQSFFKRWFVQEISPTECFTSFRDLFLKILPEQLTTEQRRCQHHSFTSSKSLGFIHMVTWSDPSVTQDRTAALEPSASAAAASHPSEPHPVVQRSLAKPRSVDSRIHDDHKRTSPVCRKVTDSMANGYFRDGLEGLMLGGGFDDDDDDDENVVQTSEISSVVKFFLCIAHIRQCPPGDT